MSGLVSDKEMAALRGVALSGMVTPVEVKRRSLVETVEGSEERYTTIGTVDGWMTEVTSDTTSTGIIGGVQAAPTVYRLFMPVGTDILSDDEVVVSGETFIVQHTNSDNTYLPLLSVALRRPE